MEKDQVIKKKQENLEELEKIHKMKEAEIEKHVDEIKQ